MGVRLLAGGMASASRQLSPLLPAKSRAPLSLLQLAADSVDPAALSALLLPYTEHKSPKVRGRTAIVLSLAQARVQVQPESGHVVMGGACVDVCWE